MILSGVSLVLANLIAISVSVSVCSATQSPDPKCGVVRMVGSTPELNVAVTGVGGVGSTVGIGVLGVGVVGVVGVESPSLIGGKFNGSISYGCSRRQIPTSCCEYGGDRYNNCIEQW